MTRQRWGRYLRRQGADFWQRLKAYPYRERLQHLQVRSAKVWRSIKADDSEDWVHRFRNQRVKVVGYLKTNTPEDWRGYLKVQSLVFRQHLATNPSWLPGAGAAAISLILWQVGVWQPLERVGYNTLFKVRQLLPHEGWASEIVLVAIDDESLQEYGSFPWSRDRYTQLLQSLKAAPPAVVGFNILFAEPTPEDAALAQAMVENGSVVLAVGWDASTELVPLVPTFDQVAGVGHIYNPIEPDGISRQVSLYVQGFPAFGVDVVRAYNSKSDRPIPLIQSLPKLEQQNAWVNWPGSREDLHPATYSFRDVVAGRVPPEALAGKIVLVGPTATGLSSLQTPFDQNPPASSLQLHAAVIDNLLKQRFLQRLPWPVEGLLILTVGVGSSLVLASLGFKRRTAMTLLVPISWVAIATILFTSQNLWIPIAAPVGCFLLAGAGIQVRDQLEKQQIMSLFVRHVSPQTAALIWRNRASIFQHGQLEAQELMATVLFMDIRNFTTISESMSPREVLNWLNLYLGTMTNCILKYDGVVDKYIGDAIMAVFGIPLPHTSVAEIRQDALNAVTAAIAMQEQLTRLNQRLQQSGLPTIQHGIGIHTGMVVAGSVGSPQRLNYSVIGDTVNIAARLERLNKELKSTKPHTLLVSSTTFDYVHHRFVGSPVQTLQLRGRQEPTVVYEITSQL
ncbi:adenylate/guanylate cyclase domain-containing protein [Cyanobacteria bacterium FACHB-471]|nr:adenylate/guanylate cyclase domain-containing protein [Cyanobacteria bacterium FACHB-471]